MSTRKEYVEKLKARLDEWNAEIDLLEAKARQTGTQAERHYLDQVSELKRRREEAAHTLRQVQEASDEAWHKLKEGADRLWDNVSTTMQETKKAFFDGLK
jgi:uncharacterized coiled-coil DUF342 family protein